MKSVRFSKIFSSAVAVAGLAISTQASALDLVFNTVGDVHSVTYSFAPAGEGVTLQAMVTYELTSLVANTAMFAVIAENSTNGPNDNRLVSFGVDVVAPTLSGASATNSQPTVGEWGRHNYHGSAWLPAG